MAHNIEYNNGRGTHSFYSRKELAWHGLGQVVQDAKTPYEVLNLANLDYEVDYAPLFASFIPDNCNATPVTTPSGIIYEMRDKVTNTCIDRLPKKGALIETNRAIYRTDSQEVLGIVGNKYEIVQNSSSIDFIYNILKNNPDITDRDNIIIETAGVLGKGERIFVTAKLPNGFKVGKDDATDMYIVFTNSHDGTTSLTAMITPIRVVCNNTLTAALGSNKSKMAFRHTRNINKAMSEGLQLLQLSYDTMQFNKEVYEKMLTVKVDNQIVTDLVYKLILDNNQYDKVCKLGLANVGTETISTRTENRITELVDYIDRGCGQELHRGTAYWAYMGINSFINNGNDYKDLESKFDNLLGGTSSKLDVKALDLCLSL